MRRVLAYVALIVLASAASGPAVAATFAATTVEDAARMSDAIVRGRVASTAARATKDARIVTDVEVVVSEAWKGAPGEMVFKELEQLRRRDTRIPARLAQVGEKEKKTAEHAIVPCP